MTTPNSASPPPRKEAGEPIRTETESSSRGGMAKAHAFLHAQPNAVSGVILCLTVVGFGLVVGERFLSPFNFSLILQQVTVIGVLGVAQTIIILTAGIDLSVGAIMVLTSVVMGKAGMEWGVPASLAVLVGLLAGMAAGAANGLLVAKTRLPPFIATLGTWNVFFALNLWYSQSETIRSQDIAENAAFLQFLGIGFDFLGARFTFGSIFMVALILLFWFVLNHTAWGRHVYATGDDPAAAELSGIKTDRVLISVYAVGGIVCALGGWALIGRIGSVSPQAGYTANLDSITAVVIGGTSLFGGRGSIAGTLMGALTVGVFRNGLALAGVDVLWQEFTVGLLIILAVGLDQWIRKISS